MRNVVVIPVLLLSLLPSTAFAAETPIRIAVLCPLSGPVPAYGVSTREGAQMAVDEWNAKGGVLGRSIEVIVEDSQCMAGPAAAAATKVIDRDKVRYIIGEVCSGASIPVSEIANARGVVQLSPVSTNPRVTVDASGRTKPYTFRACFTDDVQGRAGADFAIQRGFTKAFLMYDPGNSYVSGMSEYFEREFTTKGGTIVGKEPYRGADADFSGILAGIQAAKPDIVYLPDFVSVVNTVLKLARLYGLTMPFMGGDGWESTDLDLGAADGCYFTNHFSATDSRPRVQSFVQAYASKYGGKTADALAALAYEATNMLLTAIRIASVDSADMVRDSLEKIVFTGLGGRTTFDARHNPVKSVTIVNVTASGLRFEAAL